MLKSKIQSLKINDIFPNPYKNTHTHKEQEKLKWKNKTKQTNQLNNFLSDHYRRSKLYLLLPVTIPTSFSSKPLNKFSHGLAKEKVKFQSTKEKCKPKNNKLREKHNMHLGSTWNIYYEGKKIKRKMGTQKKSKKNNNHI